MVPPEKKKAAAEVRKGADPAAASKYFGQPLSAVAMKLDLLCGYLRQHGQPVLDTQPLDLAVTKIAAIANKLPPRRR